MFPDFSDSFAAFERPPTDFVEMDAEISEKGHAEVALSSAGQSLLRGKTLDEVVGMQQRFVISFRYFS